MELIVAFLIGIVLGIFTGITPGIHSNLAASAIAAYLGLKEAFGNETIAVMIISMGVTHSIVDTLPSIFLGMPDADKIMSALPAHRMLFNGRGVEAVTLSVTGTLFGTILSIAIMPLTILFFSFIYSIVKSLVSYILLSLVIILIMNEKHRLQSLSILLLTGLLGTAVFKLNLKEPLLPLLSGLFGISALLLGLLEKSSIPKQTGNCSEITKKEWLKPSFISLTLGILSAFLPGLGPSQIAALGSKAIKNITERGYIVLASALSTINLIAGIAAFYALGKSRSGIIVAIQGITGNISIYETILMAFAALAAGGIASIITIMLAKKAAIVMPKINYAKICIIIMIFIGIIVTLISGPLGLIVLLTASATGLIAPLKKIPRHNMMGCILIPVILFFLGIRP